MIKNVQLQNIKTKAYAVLKQIWPTVYKIINSSLYFLLTVIKSMIRTAMDQIENK